MIITLHMCGPEGDVRRQQLTNLLNDLKKDNEYVIAAMLNAGDHVPDTVIEMGLEYEPARGAEKKSPRQAFYGFRKMMDEGTFRCGDAAAYEAAVMEVKYGVPTVVIVVPQDDNAYHGLYVTEQGPVDPTENWLRYWEAKTGDGSQKSVTNPAAGRVPVQDYPGCMIKNGRVECDDVDDDTSGCCVLPNGRWRCPPAHPLHGRKADVRARETRGRQRWALVGADRTPVPVCPRPRRHA